MSGTLQVGGLTLGTHNSGTGKVDITNAGATTVTTLNTTSISSGTLGSSVVVPASIGSSMVLIKKVDISGTPASVIFDNSNSDVTFDTTYDNYVFYLSNIIPTDNNVNFYAVLRTNGSDISSTYFGGSTAYYDNNSGQGTTSFDFGNTVFSVPEVHHNESNGGISATITLYKPCDSNVTTSATIPYVFYRSNNYVYGGCAVNRVQAQTLINGIKFYWGGSSGTFKNVGAISMYGIKNA